MGDLSVNRKNSGKPEFSQQELEGTEQSTELVTLFGQAVL